MSPSKEFPGYRESLSWLPGDERNICVLLQSLSSVACAANSSSLETGLNESLVLFRASGGKLSSAIWR